jgi:phage terminase large subunit-like protein
VQEPDYPTKGMRVVKFCEQFLTLNGSFAGQPFVPMDWMADMMCDLYRINPDTGRRQYRTYLLGVPRKNAKSTLAAGVAVYQLIVDRSDAEPQIIIAASTRDQARIIFAMARGMIEGNADLASVCTVHRNEITNRDTGGVLKVVSAEAGSIHGLNPSTVIIDEYHAHRNDQLYVALNTGSAMRAEPLTVVISTAGHDMDSPLGKLYQIGRKVQSGEVVDPSFGMTWYGPAEDEHFGVDDESVWERFNPSWELMNLDEFRSTQRHTAEAEFTRYRLNGWTATQDAWLPQGVWQSCYNADRHLEPGDRVVLGFDGAFAGDCTAIVAVRMDDLHVEPLHLWERPDGDKAWRTPIKEVDAALREAFDRFKVRELVADPYFFQQTLQELEDDGFPVVEFPTNGTRMQAPSKTFFDSVLDRELSHNGDPALARHVANTQLKQDARGSRIGKEYRSSSRHIDLTVATVIALGRARAWREQEQPREATVHLL